MTRAALYARVSTDDQAERGYGLAAQLADLRRRAAERGYEVPDGAEFVDDGHSGATLERPALARLRDLVRAGAVDVVLIHDPDRLARKLAFQLLLLEEFEARARVEFVMTDNADTMDGRLLRNMRGAIAEFDRERIRDRMARGRRERLRQGWVTLSTAPFGYRIVGERHERLEVVPEEAATVRMMYAWLIEEQRSLRSIARELQQLGVPTRHGAKWRVVTVRKVLANPVYIGRVTFHAAGEAIELQVPAIISEPVWAAAAAQFRRNAEAFRGRPLKRFYLLSGLVRCALCNRRMGGMTTIAGDTFETRYYYCTNRDPVIGEGCPTKAHAEQLETRIWTAVAGILRDPAVLTATVGDQLERIGLRTAEARTEAEQLRRRLVELERAEDRMLALWAATHDDEPVAKVAAQLKALAGQRRKITERLAVVDATATSAGAAQARHEAIARYCTIAARGLDRLTPEGRQRLLRNCVDAITVRDDRFEVQGVLPGRTVQPENDHSSVSAWTISGVLAPTTGGSSGRA